MLSGVLRRAVLAHLLMGTLLLSFVTCLPQTRKSPHSCCASIAESGRQVKNNCCEVRAPEPAELVNATPPPGAAASSAALAPIAHGEAAGQAVVARQASSPPRGSPRGAFQLRI